MSATEHILYLLEAPRRSRRDWCLRVDLSAFSSESLVRLGRRCSSRAQDGGRVRRAIMGHLEGELDAPLVERILEDEGVLDELVLAETERVEPDGASSSIGREARPGALRRTVNVVSNGVCHNVDAGLRAFAWFGRRTATALAVWFLALLGLGLGLSRLVSLGLIGLGIG